MNDVMIMICDCKIYICNDKNEKFLGKGPIMLLRKVDRYGSLNRAAGEMNLSYRKALKMIKGAEEGLGFTLITRTIGGENGGGSQLTPEAYKLIEKYDMLEQRIRSSSEQIFREIFEN